MPILLLMPREKAPVKQVKKVKTVAEATEKPVDAPVAAEAKTAPKKVVKKVRVAAKAAAAPPPPKPPVTPIDATTGDETPAETVDESFQELVNVLEAEIARIKADKTATTNAQYLRGVLRRTKQLRADNRSAVRKGKKKTPRQSNGQSGFMRETEISDKLADFFKVPHGSRMSRIECTKRLQAFILENKLQKESDKREILPNKALANLLGYKKETHGPLMYYTMQKLIQQHFALVNPTPAAN